MKTPPPDGQGIGTMKGQDGCGVTRGGGGKRRGDQAQIGF